MRPTWGLSRWGLRSEAYVRHNYWQSSLAPTPLRVRQDRDGDKTMLNLSYHECCGFPSTETRQDHSQHENLGKNPIPLADYKNFRLDGQEDSYLVESLCWDDGDLTVYQIISDKGQRLQAQQYNLSPLSQSLYFSRKRRIHRLRKAQRIIETIKLDGVKVLVTPFPGGPAEGSQPTSIIRSYAYICDISPRPEVSGIAVPAPRARVTVILYSCDPTSEESGERHGFEIYDAAEARYGITAPLRRKVSDEIFTFHSDPFFADCRAYGKINRYYEDLRDKTRCGPRRSRTGPRDVEIRQRAVPCYRYMTLAAEYEEALRDN
ncbi:hypothetical protein FHL15_006259 [Xylaria flabelliformis]|uniref:Uncharacterized protein n=1 Tax=Xylaria flabelliformis TaxID=2512241 RepID=A0A553HY22_9PEZI|nr:hypothetical protein FHL15_006259 [Xylaria flabelliformis]